MEEAIARLFDLDGILDGLCKEIQNELGFDYVAVQLIHPIARTIEAVFGTDRVSLIGVKHPMDVDEDLGFFRDWARKKRLSFGKQYRAVPVLSDVAAPSLGSVGAKGES
uniref:Uncharacterized protein n=1 Tax=Candidatus Kentrum sp. FW TaxID=2126338 RepID=A0A450T2N9_9GAMM|nr:MAG: hypothetical protein BECKFW1821B_GA0114236_105912 [Candidatus Kentron sp. FW]